MGFADKAKSGGGSSLEGKVVDNYFTNYFPLNEELEADEKGNFYWVVEIQKDGAEETDLRPYYLGSGRFLVICDEDGEPVKAKKGLIKGAVVKGGEDGEVDEENTPRMYDKGAVYRMINSMEEAGFPAESIFPDPSESKTLDFRGLNGWRLRIGQEVDTEGQLAAGKKKLGAKAAGKTTEQILEAGKRDGKGKHKGKKFNLTVDKVVKVFNPDEEPATTPKAKAAKAEPKGKKVVDEDDSEETDTPSVSVKDADKFLVATVGAQPKKSIDKKGLVLAMTRYAAKIKMSNEERDAIRSFISADDFAFVDDAAERGKVEVSKKGIVTLPGEDEDDE